MRSGKCLRLLLSLPFTVSFGIITGLFFSGCGAPHVTYLSVSPGRSSIALGQSTSFRVVANYSDGTTEDVTASCSWTALNPTIATINASGVASSVSVGTTTIVAIAEGRTGTASLIVSKAALTAISVISPGSPIPLGQSAQFKAEGTYTDKSVEDISDQVTWSAASPSVAAISSTGLALSKTVGTTQVTASLNNLSGSGQITVSAPALAALAVRSKDASAPLGATEQFSASGTYTDGSIADLTSAATWLSSAPGIVNINAAGLGTAKAVGSVSITATVGGVNGMETFAVSSAALVSIAVSASHSSLPLGATEQLNATGTYSDKSTKDITGSVTWTSSAPGVISVGSGGTAQTRSVGTAAIAAASANITGSTNLSVSPATLVGITISATSESIPVGETLQLTAIGTLTDGSTQDLTSSVSWASSSPTVLSIRGSGLASGLSIGSAGVTASTGSVKGAKNLKVSVPVLSAIKLSPAGPTVPLGSSLQLAITGTYSDGSTQDVSQQVSWNVEDPTIATVTSGGFVTGLRVGSTGVEASLNGVQASDTLTVQPLLAVAYFDATSGIDSTFRVTNPGTTGQDLCAMVYVFDQDQQMSECCGCLISQDGLLTLSLKRNLLSNPLTGVASKSGTVMLVSGQQLSVGGCNAASVVPSGTVVAWATHLPQSKSGVMSSAETPFSSSPLSAILASSLQAQCSFIQQLGSGQGVCGCGSGPQ